MPQIPALYGIDTRLLTKKIREKGSLKARIELEPAFFSPEVRASLASYPPPKPLGPTATRAPATAPDGGAACLRVPDARCQD